MGAFLQRDYVARDGPEANPRGSSETVDLVADRPPRSYGAAHPGTGRTPYVCCREPTCHKEDLASDVVRLRWEKRVLEIKEGEDPQAGQRLLRRGSPAMFALLTRRTCPGFDLLPELGHLP